MKKCSRCGDAAKGELVKHICSVCDLKFDASTFEARLHLRHFNGMLYLLIYGLLACYVVTPITEQWGRLHIFQIVVGVLLLALIVLDSVHSWLYGRGSLIVSRDCVRIVHPDFGRMDIDIGRIDRVELEGGDDDRLILIGRNDEQLFSFDEAQLRGLRLIEECYCQINRRLEDYRERSAG